MFAILLLRDIITVPLLRISCQVKNLVQSREPNAENEDAHCIVCVLACMTFCLVIVCIALEFLAPLTLIKPHLKGY